MQEVNLRKQKENVKVSTIQFIREWKQRVFGKFGEVSEKVGRQPAKERVQPYSMSLISAISQEEVVGVQLIEGGVDTSVFENFIYGLLRYVRSQLKFENKPVVLLMDNATIHRHQMVSDTVLAMRAFLLYTPQYSPQLNPIERFFRYVKTSVRAHPLGSK